MHIGKAVILLSSVLCVSAANRNPKVCTRGGGDDEIVAKIKIQCDADGVDCINRNGSPFAEIYAEDCKQKTPMTLKFKVTNMNQFEIKLKKQSKFTFNGQVLDINGTAFIMPGQTHKLKWKGYYNSCTTTENEIAASVRVTTRGGNGKKIYGACNTDAKSTIKNRGKRPEPVVPTGSPSPTGSASPSGSPSVSASPSGSVSPSETPSVSTSPSKAKGKKGKQPTGSPSPSVSASPSKANGKKGRQPKQPTGSPSPSVSASPSTASGKKGRQPKQPTGSPSPSVSASPSKGKKMN